MSRLYSFVLVLALLLAGCGSVPPAPVDRFYRLQPVIVSSAEKLPSGAIFVQPFRADSLYAERPMIYSEAASASQLRQYHYHLWLYPPAQLVRENLLASLRASLDLSGESSAVNVLEGRVVGFERALSGKSSKAVVSLELRLQAGGKTVLNKTYQAEQQAGDESLDAFAVAMEQALGKIYVAFLADVARSR